MWVARDKDWALALFTHKPKRNYTGQWQPITYEEVPDDDFTTIDWMELNPNLFPDLKWEDEPIEVELKIKE